MDQAVLFLISISAGLFFCYPSGTIANWMGLPPAMAEQWYLKALGGGISVSTLLVGFRSRLHRPTFTSMSQTQSLDTAAKILLGLIFFRALFFINSPLNDDERRVVEILSRTSLREVLDPLTTLFYPNSPNHLLAHLSSWLSIHLFGTSPWTVRLPSVFFSLIFIFALAALLSNASALTSRFLLLHLLVNSCLIFNLASSRGYASMLASSTLLVVYLQRKNLNLYVLTLLMGLCALTHTFGAVFVAMAAVALILTSDNQSARSTVSKALLLMAPLIAWWTSRELSGWHRAGGARGETFHAGKWIEVMHTFGLDHFRVAKGLVILFVLALLGRTLLDKRRDFYWVFTWIAVLGFGITTWAMNVGGLRGRFFLAFLIPLILFLLQTAERLKNPHLRRIAYLALFLCLILSPVRVNFRGGLDDILFQR